MVGEIAALATALLWSWNALLFTSAGREVGSFAVNVIRIFFGTVFLAVTHFILIGDYSVSERGLYALVLSGFIGLVIGDLALFKSYVILGGRLSMLILALAPAFTSIIAFIFLNEILSPFEIGGIIITIIGIYWVLYESRGNHSSIHGSMKKGILLALIGAICQAVGLVIAKYGLNDMVLDPLYATLIRMVTALVGVTILMFIRNRTRQVSTAFKTPKALKLIFLGSIFGPFLGIWLSMVSIKYTSTGVGATIMSTSPILIIPFSIIFHKDKPSIKAIIGTFIALFGVFILFWK